MTPFLTMRSFPQVGHCIDWILKFTINYCAFYYHCFNKTTQHDSLFFAGLLSSAQLTRLITELERRDALRFPALRGLVEVGWRRVCEAQHGRCAILAGNDSPMLGRADLAQPAISNYKLSCSMQTTFLKEEIKLEQQ